MLGFLAECQRFGISTEEPAFQSIAELAKLKEAKGSTGFSEDQLQYLELWDRLKAETAAVLEKRTIEGTGRAAFVE